MNNIAFLIGCEEYDHNGIPNLEGVNNDVESMENALVRNCSCLPERVFIINNQSNSACDLSGFSILSFLFQKANELSNEQFDNLFFYFSGHGYLSQDNMVCLMHRDSMLFPIQHGAITQEAIISVLKQFNYVKHIIVFLDMSPELLRLFIQRIEVGERTVKHSRHASQNIRIFYRDIGDVDSAMEHGEQQPKIIPTLPQGSECMKLLA